MRLLDSISYGTYHQLTPILTTYIHTYIILILLLQMLKCNKHFVDTPNLRSPFQQIKTITLVIQSQLGMIHLLMHTCLNNMNFGNKYL